MIIAIITIIVRGRARAGAYIVGVDARVLFAVIYNIGTITRGAINV